MKHALIDVTTKGIIFVADVTSQRQKWEMSLMQSCILDTGIFKVLPKFPMFSEINNDSIQHNFYTTGRASISIGNSELANEYFIQKRQTAQLIYPLIESLTTYLYMRSVVYIEDHAVPMDDTIAIAVLESDHAANNYSAGVLDYAAILDITPSQAYQELKIEYETVHSIKMRVYAASKKYTKLIRGVSTKEQADTLHNEIKQQLYSETFL